MTDGEETSGGRGSDRHVYRGMTRDELDAGYNNTEAVADSPQQMENWIVKSNEIRALSNAVLDLRYGSRPNNSIDFFKASASGQGLFIFVHGGYWQRNNKEMFAFVSEGLCAENINVATLGYTLAPDASLTQIVAEIRAAIDYLIASAADLDFDIKNVYLGGWSAGGHLSAISADHKHIKGIVSISGIFDLDPISKCYLDEKLQLSMREILELSPANVMTVADKKVILFAGAQELPELQRQSASYAAIIEGHCAELNHRVIEERNHYSILQELMLKKGIIAACILNFMHSDAE